MTPEQMEWSRTGDELVGVIKDLGFPEELGSEIAKMLGSPKAMRRMISYLYYDKPKTAELIVDEALSSGCLTNEIHYPIRKIWNLSTDHDIMSARKMSNISKYPCTKGSLACINSESIR